MTTVSERSPIVPGESAPNFTLPSVDREGLVSLADYRGRSPVLLAMFNGLYCPFCRRAIAQLGAAANTLESLGVKTLAIVATSTDNARLYFRFRPTRAPLAADPELTTHRAYGLPHPPVTPALLDAVHQTRINPTGELSEPLPIADAAQALNKIDAFSPTKTDQEDFERQFSQLKGQFLVDREGIVRWTNIEAASEGLAGFGKFPSEQQLAEVARALR